ncbi:unnamed protein product, partial [Symbiodinium sp. KB8]
MTPCQLDSLLRRLLNLNAPGVPGLGDLTRLSKSSPKRFIEVYDALEIFAGVASLSRCLGMAGYSVAALNLTFWDGLTAAGTDKYEKDKVEYWVEEETKGSYKLLHSEAWSDKRQIDATEDDGPAEGTDHENDDDDDGTDDSDGATSDSSDSSTSCAKKKRGKRSNAKKSKKDKKQKKSKKAKKKSKRNKSSPSSKTGSPKKAQLEEEVRAEAIENAGEIMSQLLRVQSKVE